MARHSALYQRQFTAMASLNQLQVYADSAEEANHLLDCIEAEVKRIEGKFSRYNPESIVSRINAAAGVATTLVDEETAGLIDYGATCYRESGGWFDLTSGVLRRCWDFTGKVLPSTDALAALLPLVGWDKVEWKRPHLRLRSLGMEIDLGGIAKEYAADAAARVATKEGCPSGLVNLGGDVRIIGQQRPDGTPWRIGIRHPRAPDHSIASIPVSSGAVATSGDYERYFELNGERYCHLLNPRTGYPVTGYQSVTVHAPECIVAGSFATIGMLLGIAKGGRMLRESGLPFLTVGADGVLDSHVARG